MKEIEINLEEYKLRSLDLKDDLQSYLYWMSHPENNEFILSARNDYSLPELRDFIKSCNSHPKIILLGIFNKKNNSHIGNIKYDSIDLSDKSAVMGVLIGDKNHRGRGIAKKVIEGSAKWLNLNLSLQTIFLGVDQNNSAAVKLYSKIGFIPESHQSSGELKMRWDLNVK